MEKLGVIGAIARHVFMLIMCASCFSCARMELGDESGQDGNDLFSSLPGSGRINWTQMRQYRRSQTFWDGFRRRKALQLTEELSFGSHPKYEGEYTDVQFVGLSIYTFPQYTNYSDNGMQFYKGIVEIVRQHEKDDVNNTDDALARVTLMEKFMDKAYKSKHWDKDAKVLKIFMAPEFFFRGAHGAYNMKLLENCGLTGISNGKCTAPAMRILSLLRKAVNNTKWDDWLFVFGTILLNDGINYYNFAPIMRGGLGATKHHLVFKHFYSHIDFLNCDTQVRKGDRRHCTDDIYIRYASTRYTPLSVAQNQILVEDGFEIVHDSEFWLDGIHFGVEVCLDHAYGTLWQATHKNGGVHVHLVTSGGMSLMYFATAGPVFLQDGGHKAKSQYAELQVVPSKLREIVTTPLFPETYNATYLLTHFFPYYWGSNPIETMNISRLETNVLSAKGFSTETVWTTSDYVMQNDIRQLFAVDNIIPRINIGPKFKIG